MLHIAKQHDIPIFLVGHVTKSGDIAGPKVLEHIVDVVLYMEGEKHQSFRYTFFCPNAKFVVYTKMLEICGGS